MFEMNAYLAGLGVLVAMGLITWVISVIKRNVSIVDSLWSIMFIAAAATYFLTLTETGPRALLVLVLVSV